MGKRPRIPVSITLRAPVLLPMMYRTRELGEVLGVTPQLIVRWTKLGAPYVRDSRGHIWIMGRDIADWLVDHKRPKSASTLGFAEGYCLRCRRAVEMQDPVSREQGNMTLITGTCPICGAEVNRGRANDQP